MPYETQLKQQDKKKRVWKQLLFLVFLVTVTVATMQLLQGNQLIQNQFRTPTNAITDQKKSDGFLNVKERLRKFLKDSSVHQSNKQYQSSSGEIGHNRNSTTPVNPLISILEKSRISLTSNILEQIPPYSDIIKMYGNKPIVIGLDRCEEFQQHVSPPDRTLAVAG
jgi:cytoskeletal protein RodZ